MLLPSWKNNYPKCWSMMLQDIFMSTEKNMKVKINIGFLVKIRSYTITICTKEQDLNLKMSTRFICGFRPARKSEVKPSSLRTGRSTVWHCISMNTAKRAPRLIFRQIPHGKNFSDDNYSGSGKDGSPFFRIL